MYQRKAQTVGPMDGMGVSSRKVLAFFDEAARQLNAEGKEDEAFYFEQVAEYLRSGKELTDDPRKITTILGL